MSVNISDPSTEDVSLWRHPDFLKFWTGQSLSLVGTQMTVVALPLLAVAVLNASMAQMGVLAALGRLPYILILFIGVWVDRVRRRPLLVTADLGRGLLLLSVPVVFYTGDLSLPLLFAVMLCVGVFSMIFDISYAAYLPSLVARSGLAEANSRLQLSTATAEVAGPGVVALLLRWVSAAGIILIDAISYLLSALALLLIRRTEEPPARDEVARPHVFAAIWAGLRWVWNQPLLRPTLISTAFFMFFMPAIQAVYFFFAYRELGISATWIALILTLGGPGAIIGSALAPRIIRRIGLGPMCVIAALGGNTSFLLIPLATEPEGLAITLLAAAQLLFGFTMPLGAISTLTIGQAITPDRMQGRVAATFRAFSFGLAPLGALAAGFAGELIGLRTTILIAAIGLQVPIVILLLSPIPRLREVPPVAEPEL